MKKKIRKYTLFLDDILLSMERINEYISGKDINSFIKDYKTTDAVIRTLKLSVKQ